MLYWITTWQVFFYRVFSALKQHNTICREAAAVFKPEIYLFPELEYTALPYMSSKTTCTRYIKSMFRFNEWHTLSNSSVHLLPSVFSHDDLGNTCKPFLGFRNTLTADTTELQTFFPTQLLKLLLFKNISSHYLIFSLFNILIFSLFNIVIKFCLIYYTSGLLWIEEMKMQYHKW